MFNSLAYMNYKFLAKSCHHQQTFDAIIDQVQVAITDWAKVEGECVHRETVFGIAHSDALTLITVP